MNTKKTLALILALVLAMSCCSFAMAEETPTYHFKLLRRVFDESPTGTLCQDTWLQMEEEYLGVKLDLEWIELPSSEYQDKMGVYLASNDTWADAFLIANSDYFSAFDDYGKQGLFVNLNDYLTEDNYYTQWLNESEQNRLNVTSSDGGIYRFADAHKSEKDRGNQRAWAVRFDIFEENNIAIPTSLDEIYEAAKQLKAIYPDSYPVTVAYGDLNRWFTLQHTYNSIMYDGEKYIYAPYTNAAENKKILEYLNKLYTEQLLDPEYLTDGDEAFGTKLLNGKYMISSLMWGNGIKGYNSNTEYSVKWGMIAEPKNVDGGIGYRETEHEIGKKLSNGSGTIINSNAENIDILFKMIDYQYSDEIVDLTNWGVKDVTYTEDENGNKEYVPEIKNAENPQAALGKYGVNQSMSVRSGILYIPQLNDAAMKLVNAAPYFYNGEFGETTVWEFSTMVRNDIENCMPLEPARIAFDDDQLETATINKTALDTFVNEEYSKFISGDRSLDEYDAFVEEIASYGDIALLEQTYNDSIAK